MEISWQAFSQYGMRYYDDMIEYVLEHIMLTGVSVFISLLVAIPFTLLILQNKKLVTVFLSLTGCIYSIPSMALFAILMPFFGLGEKTAIITLALFCQFILLRNFVAGFESVPDLLVETGKAMGLTPFQVLLQVRLPIALPVMIAGVRLCVISTIASAVIAQTINSGGIGELIFKGLRTLNMSCMLWGALLAGTLAIISNVFFEAIEKKALLYATGQRLNRRKSK